MNPSLRAAAVALVLLTLPAAAQQPSPGRFRFERPIDTGGAGPRRLAVDVPLLTGAAPYRRGESGERAFGLSDLRLFDQRGSSVQYLLLQPPPQPPQWVQGDLLPVAPTEKTSGFEADFREPQIIDAVLVLGLPAPFLKRLTLEGSGDRSHWIVLAAEGTLFDLPDEGLRQTELRFPAGSFRYVRVTWDDRNSGRLPAPSGVQARRVSGLVPPPLTARVAAESRPSEPGRSRYRIKLPAPRLPIVAFDVVVSGSTHVFRQAWITESRLLGLNVGPAEIGRGQLRQVSRDDVVGGAMRIPVSPPTEAEVDLVIENGNNPPLDVNGVTLVFDDLPWIYFEAPEGPVLARYGNSSSARPAYDLEAVRGVVHVESIKDARWGDPRRVPDAAESRPAGPSAIPDTGSVVDADLFAYRRPLSGGPPGLVALVVDIDALAHSRGPDAQFADVRILDRSNRQVPYVIERRDEPMSLPLTLERREPPADSIKPLSGAARSNYLIRLPYTDLPSARAVLETSARVFQRAVQLAVERPADRNHRAPWLGPVALRTWSHVDQDEAASALVLPLSRSGSTDFWLSIDDGDNSTLPITSARLLLPSYRLRFYRPAGAELRMVYGRGDLAAPRYDLALLAPQVIGVEAQELTAVPESPSERRARSPFISVRAFWMFLSIAVLVLLGLIVRLARRGAV